MFRHENIRIRRVALQWTLEDLAGILNLKSPSAISLWEQGRRTPSTYSIGKLARALKVPVSFFYDLNSCVPSTQPWRLGVTPRQRQVLYGLAAGMTHRQIAMHLGVCTRTIDFHHSALNRLFGVSSVVLLLRETVRFQILPESVLGIHTSALLQRVLN
jgi:DNA-binding CsgD family transcriptional regulator/DNA-binding XRE family transcriptional regulator